MAVMQAPPAAATSLVSAPEAPTSDLACSAHPDAVKRRKEMEEWRKRREAERQKAQQLAAAGLKWWEGEQPSNVIVARSAADYRNAVAHAAEQGKLLVAKFFTEDCYVCKSLHPKIKNIAHDNPDVLWVKLNGSDPSLVELFQALNITKVPLFHMVRDGELVSELSVSLSPEKLSMFRAELAAHKPAARKPAPVGAASSTEQAAAQQQQKLEQIVEEEEVACVQAL